jgi:hypothetical protein
LISKKRFIIAYLIFTNRLFREIIETLTQELNLKLIVPADINNIDEDSVFLVANLYTKSRLGEDALINVSIEKTLDKRIIGTSIIRSKVKVKLFILKFLFCLGICNVFRG